MSDRIFRILFNDNLSLKDESCFLMENLSSTTSRITKKLDVDQYTVFLSRSRNLNLLKSVCLMNCPTKITYIMSLFVLCCAVFKQLQIPGYSLVNKRLQFLFPLLLLFITNWYLLKFTCNMTKNEVNKCRKTLLHQSAKWRGLASF